MVVVYQDSTHNDLLLNIFQGNQWLANSVLIDDRGAVGYGNSIHAENGQATIGSVRFQTTTGGREKSTVQLYSVDLTTD
jgi:hypothetical protein